MHRPQCVVHVFAQHEAQFCPFMAGNDQQPTLVRVRPHGRTAHIAGYQGDHGVSWGGWRAYHAVTCGGLRSYHFAARVCLSLVRGFNSPLLLLDSPSCVLCLLLSECCQIMAQAAAGGAPKVGRQYVRFFQTHVLDNGQKVRTLYRLLKEFYDVPAQLDKHLAPVGASFHAVVSRMVEFDNPSAPPQYRCIRIVDRLQFFWDDDDHASRVVNAGTSDAYRYQELHHVTAAVAVRLKALRLSVA